jgi:hypothetical protein
VAPPVWNAAGGGACGRYKGEEKPGGKGHCLSEPPVHLWGTTGPVGAGRKRPLVWAPLGPWGAPPANAGGCNKAWARAGKPARWSKPRWGWSCPRGGWSCRRRQGSLLRLAGITFCAGGQGERRTVCLPGNSWAGQGGGAIRNARWAGSVNRTHAGCRGAAKAKAKARHG